MRSQAALKEEMQIKIELLEAKLDDMKNLHLKKTESPTETIKTIEDPVTMLQSLSEDDSIPTIGKENRGKKKRRLGSAALENNKNSKCE